MNDYIPPLFDNTEEIEKSVLDHIISGEKSSGLAVESLEVDDFESDTHKLIFGAIKRLHGRGGPVDFLAIYGELRNIDRPNGEDWVPYLNFIQETALPLIIDNIEIHIAKLKEASRLRKTSEKSYRLHVAASRGESEDVQRLLETLIDTQMEVGMTNRLKPISAKDLPDIPPTESLWAGLIFPGCITQLNAEPGAGKSTLLYNIAALGAQGKDLLGIPFSKPIKTLYIDLESPAWLQKQKIETICDELPENFHLLSDFNLKRDINDLIRLAMAKQYDLIVFDTQSKALDLEDENDNAEANRAAALLRKLAKETGAAILLIHHTKKGDGGRKVYLGRGASALAGAVDIVSILETIDSDTLKLEIVKNRIAGIYQSITIRKIGDDKFERVSTEESQRGPELYRVQQSILNLLGDGMEWRTAEIHERVEKEGFKKRTSENALSRLCVSGKVLKTRQGFYILAGNTSNGKPNMVNNEKYQIPEELM